MKGKLTSFLIAVVFLTLASTAMATTTWYVNGLGGSDANNCTSATTACKTIGHATFLAASGDTIGIAPATYTENVRVLFSLKLIGSGASTTIINGGVGSGIAVTINPGVGPVTLANVTVTGGTGVQGAGVYNRGKLTIINSAISGNRVTSPCRIPGCTITAKGGGVYNLGTLTINNSTISNNSAKRRLIFGSGEGGGIFNQGTLTLNNCTVVGNFATNDGGGLANVGTLKINNSTIDGNSVTYRGGGISNIAGTVALQNSIVADSLPENCLGTMTSKGYNLSSDNTCPFSSTGDVDGTDPMLGPLQNNGGPTYTMGLTSGSPAIDAGNPNGCTDSLGHLLKTDQRGQPRPDSEDTGGCDMGAYESQSD